MLLAGINKLACVPDVHHRSSVLDVIEEVARKGAMGGANVKRGHPLSTAWTHLISLWKSSGVSLKKGVTDSAVVAHLNLQILTLTILDNIVNDLPCDEIDPYLLLEALASILFELFELRINFHDPAYLFFSARQYQQLKGLSENTFYFILFIFFPFFFSPGFDTFCHPSSSKGLFSLWHGD